MENKISVTIKVAPEIHQKLKLASVVKRKSITDLLIEWVEKMEIKIPETLVSSGIKKAVKPKKGTVPPEPVKATEEERETIEGKLKGMFTEGLTDWTIAKQLTEDCIPTFKGGQKWYASTVTKLREKLSPESIVKPLEP